MSERGKTAADCLGWQYHLPVERRILHKFRRSVGGQGKPLGKEKDHKGLKGKALFL